MPGWKSNGNLVRVGRVGKVGSRFAGAKPHMQVEAMIGTECAEETSTQVKQCRYFTEVGHSKGDKEVECLITRQQGLRYFPQSVEIELWEVAQVQQGHRQAR